MYKGVPVPFFIDENCRLITFHKNIVKAFMADGSMKKQKPSVGDFNLPFTWEVTYKTGEIERKEMMTDEYGIVLLAYICLENPTQFLAWFDEICIDCRKNPLIIQGYLNKTWLTRVQFEFAQATDIPREEIFKE